MGILDSLVGRLTRSQSSGPYALTDDDRQALKRNGLLQAGLAMLASPSNGTQGIARGLLAGVQGVQEGADQLVNDRYRTDVMRRTQDQMAANTAREQAVRRVLNPDGTLNLDGWQQYAQLDPLEAMRLREQVNQANAPQPVAPRETRKLLDGGFNITQEWDPTTGQWTEVARAPRWLRGAGGGGGGTASPSPAPRAPGGAPQVASAPVEAAPAVDPLAGYNDKQRAGAAALQSNILQYAAAVTGRPVSELALMNPSDIAKAVREAPERSLEGTTARWAAAIPFVGDNIVATANPDLQSWSEGAASGLTAINNPTGVFSDSDTASSRAQVPSALDPRDVQATKIEAFLRQTGFRPRGGASTSPTAPPPSGAPRPGEIRNGYRFKGGNPADRNSWEKV